MKVRTDVYNQRNELVATFRRAVLVPRRPDERRLTLARADCSRAGIRQNPAVIDRRIKELSPR